MMGLDGWMTHLRSVDLHCLLSLRRQLIAIQLRSPRIVFDLSVGAGAIMGAKELCGIGIST